MNVLSLFSGIGGLDLAAEWAGMQTVAFCEIEPYAVKVLEKRWPGVPIYRDVRELTAERLGADGVEVDLITGGFPCQPHSLAGKRLAQDDERDLWGECHRLLCEVRPRWAVFENVPGLLSSDSGRFFGKVLRDISAAGHDAFWVTYGAERVGAIHKRERTFICANSRSNGRKGSENDSSVESGKAVGQERLQKFLQGPFRDLCAGPGIHRASDGVPNRTHRIKCLGNSVVPQQAYPIFKAIMEVEE